MTPFEVDVVDTPRHGDSTAVDLVRRHWRRAASWPSLQGPAHARRHEYDGCPAVDIGVFSPTTGPAGRLSRGGEAAVGAVGVHHRPRPLVPAESGVVGGSPWPTLTLVVSLEAIFLSTFVMIGQNRQAAFQQIKADHDFVEQELELKTDTELTRAIHLMTTEPHRRLIEDGAER